MQSVPLPTVIRTCAEDIESVRRTVNQTSSEVPQEVLAAFQAALDQIADQQYNACRALALLLQDDSGTRPTAESTLTAAVAEARRAGLRACRGYADREAQLASEVERELLKIPTNVSNLEHEKQDIDKRFSTATALHEYNKIEALDQLVAIASDFKEWRSRARSTIAGTKALTRHELRKQTLSTWALWAAIALGVANLVIQFSKT